MLSRELAEKMGRVRRDDLEWYITLANGITGVAADAFLYPSLRGPERRESFGADHPGAPRVSWGDNFRGQLGDGTNRKRWSPVRLRRIRDAVAVFSPPPITALPS